MAKKDQAGGRVALVFGLLAAAAFVVGPLVAFLGVAPVMTGFQIFALSGLLALATVVAGTVTAARRGISSAAPSLLLGGGLFILFIVLSLPGCGVPRINDITTDMVQPPQFVRASELPANQGRDMQYPGAEFAAAQQGAYPDLAPLALPIDSAQAFSRVERAARAMPRWEITRVDPERRELEGVATSAVFRFPDDFIVQVRERADGTSLVHMRSKSRFGRSDLGANAARIDAFFAAVRADESGRNR